MQQLREDLRLVYDWIVPGSKVLDLGCGDGQLLAALVQDKGCQGYGVELDTDSVIAAMNKGVNVIQVDLEQGLRSAFTDHSFDVVVLSQTIQAMKNTEHILYEMKRVARQAIVTFPNFGYWRNRVQIAQGRMPVSESMPYEWYNTPNIHWCTLADFDALCAKTGLSVLERAVMTGGQRIEFMPNLLGSLAFYRVG
ncbi:methionine biosynthesis protein MetW [Vitreoscilla stercoraria]|uniref:Methionine biosynthesis protein MetW n=1 Tax=Vitreoscilla stercoraria TaxID=61 RepID=A0ABY4EDF3_VITST|nr:methionine biosynthesis protein MetW [Vitreoscilla stercoraria]UOO93482.1 methionine biosynthesis protein MetW [Vitreoscilla stercoraria]